MLSLIILLFLISGFFIGLKRGFILQAIHLAGFIIAFIAAYIYYDDLAPKLVLWVPYPSFSDGNGVFQLLSGSAGLETAYYRAIAFVLIFAAVKIVMQMIGSMLDFVANLPVLRTLNIWAGGIFGFLETYFILFIVLYIAALLPIEGVQNLLGNSFMAKMIVSHTPILSAHINDIWIQ